MTAPAEWPAPPAAMGPWDGRPGLQGARLHERLLSPRQLLALRPPAPLVDGLLYRGTLAQLAGPPGSYKSFITVGMACAVAAGSRSWEGHRVPARLPVLYVAAEGGNGIGRRVAAWCESNRVDLDDLDLDCYPDALQLGDRGQVDELKALAARRRYGLVVFDTRARCTVGLEENSATEQGRAIDHAEEIRRASDGTVLVVHHSGIGSDRGRGSTAWDGQAWSLLHASGDDLRAQVHVDKHKEVPDGETYHYRLIPHVVSPELLPADALFEPDEQVTPDEYARRRTTLVAVQNGGWTPDVDERKSTREVLDIIRTSAGPEGLTRAQVVDLAAERKVSRSSAYEAVTALVSRHLLRNIGSDSRHRYVVDDAALLPEVGP